MSPPTVKITRSRTASARLKSNGQHSTKESLREIIRRADAGDCSKKKRNKKLAGVRFADIGGGDLTSTMVLDDEATTSQSCTSSAVQTRSVGQTCQPRVHQTSCQAISSWKRGWHHKLYTGALPAPYRRPTSVLPAPNRLPTGARPAPYRRPTGAWAAPDRHRDSIVVPKVVQQ